MGALGLDQQQRVFGAAELELAAGPRIPLAVDEQEPIAVLADIRPGVTIDFVVGLSA